MEIKNDEELQKYLTPTGKLKRTLSTEESTAVFVYRSNKVHGGVYDYSNTKYVGTHKKVAIECREHGEFAQTPSNHLKGQGCPHCSGNAPLTTEEFIEKATNLHKGRYDYSNTEYVSNKKKVMITCREHGVFSQTPNKHLSGNDCPKCSHNAPLTTEEFIEKATNLHNGRYHYANTKYISSSKKVEITCGKHGDFTQTPNSHLSGNGCPKCSGQSDVLYLWRAIGTDYYKLGITTRASGTRRVVGVARKHNWDPEILIYEECEEASKIEKELLEALRDNYKQPIRKGDGHTEIFEIPEKDVAGIIAIIEDSLG